MASSVGGLGAPTAPRGGELSAVFSRSLQHRAGQGMLWEQKTAKCEAWSHLKLA